MQLGSELPVFSMCQSASESEDKEDCSDPVSDVSLALGGEPFMASSDDFR